MVSRLFFVVFIGLIFGSESLQAQPLLAVKQSAFDQSVRGQAILSLISSNGKRKNLPWKSFFRHSWRGKGQKNFNLELVVEVPPHLTVIVEKNQRARFNQEPNHAEIVLDYPVSTLPIKIQIAGLPGTHGLEVRSRFEGLSVLAEKKCQKYFSVTDSRTDSRTDSLSSATNVGFVALSCFDGAQSTKLWFQLSKELRATTVSAAWKNENKKTYIANVASSRKLSDTFDVAHKKIQVKVLRRDQSDKPVVVASEKSSSAARESEIQPAGRLNFGMHWLGVGSSGVVGNQGLGNLSQLAFSVDYLRPLRSVNLQTELLLPVVEVPKMRLPVRFGLLDLNISFRKKSTSGWIAGFNNQYVIAENFDNEPRYLAGPAIGYFKKIDDFIIEGLFTKVLEGAFDSSYQFDADVLWLISEKQKIVFNYRLLKYRNDREIFKSSLGVEYEF